MLFFRSESSIRAENLVLRRQLAQYIERRPGSTSRSRDAGKSGAIFQAL